MCADPGQISKKIRELWQQIENNFTAVMTKVDEYLDTPSKFAYAFTDGLVGKYRKKYYLGPVRITRKAVGVQVPMGLIKVRVEIGRSKKGAWTLASKVGFGIHSYAELRLGGRIDTSGLIEPKATVRLFKRIKTVLSGGYNVKDKKKKPYGFKMRAPLYSHITYNSKKGQTFGTCGALRNEDGEWETDDVKYFLKDMALLIAGYVARGSMFRQKPKPNLNMKRRSNKTVMKKILSDEEYSQATNEDGWEDVASQAEDDEDDDNDTQDAISDNNDIFNLVDDDGSSSSCFPWVTAAQCFEFLKYCWQGDFSLGDENVNDI